jgi:hypothetical protein
MTPTFRKFNIREIIINIKFEDLEFDVSGFHLPDMRKFLWDNFNDEKLEDYLLVNYPESETELWEILETKCIRHDNKTPGRLSSFFLYRIAVPAS